MNPSTAQLLEAVEAAPADQVVILPNNKNIIPVAEQVDGQTDEDGPRRADPGHRRGLRRAAGLRPRGRRSTTTPTAMAEAAEQRRGRRGHPGGARLDLRRSARSPRATASASRRDGIRRRRQRRSPARRIELLDVLVDRRPRDRHAHRGRGRDARPTPAASPSGSPSTTPTSPPRSTTAASRCTRTSSASSSTAPDGGRTLAPAAPRLAGHASSTGVGAGARPKALRRSSSVDDTCSTCSPTTRAATSTAREQARSRDLARRRGGDGARSRSTRVDARGAPRGRRRRWSTVDVTDGSGTCGSRSSTSRGGSGSCRRAPRRCSSARSTSYQGRKQMTNPVVDLSATRPAGIVPIYPQSEKAGVTTWDLARLDRRGARRRAGEFADPVPDGGARPVRPRRPHGRVPTASTARVDGRASSEARAPAGVRRAAARPARARAAQARARARRPRASRHDVGGELVRALPRAAAVRAHRRAAAGRSPRSSATSRGPHPMHRLLQGDVGAGKTVVAVSALLVAVQGGHQGALMAPTEVLAEQHFARHPRRCSTASPCPATTTPSLFGLSDRCGSSCSPTARRRPSAGASSPRLGGGRGRHRSSAPTR